MTTAVKTNVVGWFEIPVKDMPRAKKFYEAVFGVKLAKLSMPPWEMEMWPMVPDGAGACGSLIKGDGYTPSHAGALVYFNAPDIEAALAKIKKSGGKTLVPKKSIGEYGYIALFEDCEGNRVALHSMS